MKNLIAALVLLSSGVVGAAVVEPVSFDFQSVPLVSVMQATYKNLLHRDYVIGPDILALDKKISLSIKSLPMSEVAAFVDGILISEGVLAERRDDGIYYLSVRRVADVVVPVPGVVRVPGDEVARPGVVPVAEKLPDPVKLYRPENRTVDFMVTVLNAAFGRSVARPAGQFVAVSVPKLQLSQVLDLAASVDLLPRSVEVSASFVEVATSSSRSSGLSLAAKVLGAKVGVVIGTGASGAFTLSSGSFQLVIDALVADGRFKQVSNSRVVGDESERVNLTVGDETPTLQASGRDNAGNTVQSVVYRSSGVIFDVLPKVLGAGRLSLLVDGQVSSFKATTTGVIGSPTLSKRQIKTSVTLGDGEVLLIGGLEESASSGDVSGLSFFPASWRGVSAADKRTDLLLVLSARILAVK